jgi:hypothetical protein
LGLLIWLAWAAAAGASTLLSDGNSAVTFDTRDGVLQLTSWQVNGTEEVGRKWYYWRTSGSSEVPISSLTQSSLTASDASGDSVNDKLVVVWSGSNFTLTGTFVLTGGLNGGQSAKLDESFKVSKSGMGSLTCHLFAYDNYTIGGPGTTDALSMPTSTTLSQTSPYHSLSTSYDTAPSYRQTGLATDSPGILGKLADSSSTTLSNSAGQVVGDTAAAWQWDLSFSGMSSTKTITGTNTVTTPEPATLGLLALGGMALLRRRRH